MKKVVSVAQLCLGDGDPAANLATAAAFAREASGRGSELMILPELWLSGWAISESDSHSLKANDARWETLAALASENRMAIGGSILADLDGRPRNRLVIHDRHGEIAGHYDKVHMFGQLDEGKYLAPGDRLAVVDLGWCRAGLAICYDLRFPELFRALTRLGAELIVLPAQWPLVRAAHWRTLVLARAIENQVYVLACNRTGAGGSQPFGGHSMVVDPWGEVLQEAGDTQTMLTVEIEMDRVREIRERFAVWRDVRSEVYESASSSGNFIMSSHLEAGLPSDGAAAAGSATTASGGFSAGSASSSG